MNEPLHIRPVETKRELMQFIKLPFRLYRSYRPESRWVPPLIAERKKHLDRSRNPFFKHARAVYFLAYRGDRVVGRISASVDFNFQEFQHNQWGQFGFFELEEDQEVADALLDHADGWLTAQGCDRMVGPLSFSTNHDDCGVLVDGFDIPPTILTNVTQRYYPKLLEGAGLTKAMDLRMWELNISGRHKVHQAIWDIAHRVESQHGIVVRPFNKRDIEAEVGRFIEIYNAAWERNWGFVPLTEEEVRAYAKELKPILSEHWAWVAEHDGETVGAALTLPDYNQVLVHLDGRLLPFGWITALRKRRHITRVRVFALGVKREYQHTGVAAKFYENHFDSAEATPQTSGETGWILENNKSMNRAMEGMGGEITRAYRLYERELEPADSATADVA